MEKEVGGREKVVQSTSELVGMRPSGRRWRLLALLVACSPWRGHSSGRCRGLMGQKVQGRVGEVVLLSVATITVWLEQIVWEDLGEDGEELISEELISRPF